ncbi:MAG: protoporphyrinogen oxidase [Gemmatimonadetes bacterium]|nr:protoporphyrinogen oxidase [Gemmatimonadota bacterium]MBI2535681.1 protoporphyrinogen oxidase [Gemmatimonadota bacterium]
MRVGVIGAGPSGLAVAWEIFSRARARELDVQVDVYERAPRAGGNVWTEVADGYRVEQGPEGFLDSEPRTIEIATQLGLADRLVSASDAARNRFLYVKGHLHPVPTGPLGFLRSGILSVPGRLRVFAEPLQPPGTEDDETVLAFATRRMGGEAAQRLVGAMVAGIHAGDPAALSMPAAFPELAAMERRYGSLTRALMATRREARRTGRRAGGPAGPAGRLTSFAGGLRELIEAFVRELGPRVHLSAEAREARWTAEAWRVAVGGTDEVFDRLIVTTPPWHAAALLEDADPNLATPLQDIPWAPVTAVALGFAASDLRGVNLDGFGFLVPAGQGVRLLGCLWSSSIFPGRAPAGRVLLRALVGGARDPEAAGYDDETLLDLVRYDLAIAMGIEAEPSLVRVYRHPRAIPQYTLGHLQRLSTVRDRLERLPGLLLHGNGYRGVALNDSLRLAGEIAEAAIAQ